MSSGRLVLVRHGQSHSNVARRLDTRPPGAALTDLGRRQARRFATGWTTDVAALVHSAALRAEQTAAEIGDALDLTPRRLPGLHEVQVGRWEMRNDDEAIEAFDALYRRWHHGALSESMPGGESGQQVLARVVPVLTELRARHLDGSDAVGDVVVVSHGAAIRLVAATLGGVDGSFAVAHHLANTEAVVLAPVTDGRWACVGWGRHGPPFLPEPSDVGPPDVGDGGPMG